VMELEGLSDVFSAQDAFELRKTLRTHCIPDEVQETVATFTRALEAWESPTSGCDAIKTGAELGLDGALASSSALYLAPNGDIFRLPEASDVCSRQNGGGCDRVDVKYNIQACPGTWALPDGAEGRDLINFAEWGVPDSYEFSHLLNWQHTVKVEAQLSLNNGPLCCERSASCNPAEFTPRDGWSIHPDIADLTGETRLDPTRLARLEADRALLASQRDRQGIGVGQCEIALRTVTTPTGNPSVAPSYRIAQAVLSEVKAGGFEGTEPTRRRAQAAVLAEGVANKGANVSATPSLNGRRGLQGDWPLGYALEERDYKLADPSPRHCRDPRDRWPGPEPFHCPQPIQCCDKARLAGTAEALPACCELSCGPGQQWSPNAGSDGGCVDLPVCDEGEYRLPCDDPADTSECTARRKCRGCPYSMCAEGEFLSMCMDESPGFCRKCQGVTTGLTPLWTSINGYTTIDVHEAATVAQRNGLTFSLPALVSPCRAGEQWTCGDPAYPGESFCTPADHYSSLPTWKFKLMFRQSNGQDQGGPEWTRSAEEWRAGVNTWASPSGFDQAGFKVPQYSILHTLGDEHRGEDGKFLFKMVWPRSQQQEQVWRQSSNPMTDAQCKVEGYESVSTPHTARNWGGLEACSPSALLDGSSSRTEGEKLEGAVGRRAWYAIGVTGLTGSGKEAPDSQTQIRGPGIWVDQVELYVLDPTANEPSQGPGRAL